MPADELFKLMELQGNMKVDIMMVKYQIDEVLAHEIAADILHEVLISGIVTEEYKQAYANFGKGD